MQYRIIEGYHQQFTNDPKMEDITATEDLQTKVNYLIKGGWVPIGGVCVGSDVCGDLDETHTYMYLYQAMINKNIFDEFQNEDHF